MKLLGILFTICTLQNAPTETKVVYKNVCPTGKQCYQANCKVTCRTVGSKRQCVQTCKCFCKAGAR